MRAASAMASTPGCRRVAFPRAATRATAATRWRAVQAPRILRNVAGLVRRCPSARAASCGDESSRNAVAGDEDKETSTSETTVSTSEPTVTRIPRAEALRRMDASISRRPSLSVFLEALDTTSRAAQLPPERCVWHNKLWKYATRAWSFPELLAALKTLDGAGFAEAVRLCGENQSVGTTTQLFREGASLGWCSDDGGASITAMAWTHDTHSQGALADRLWHELHDLAEKGKIDTSAIRKAGGVPDWDLRTWKKKNGQSKSKSKSKTPKFSPRVEVFMLEVASKARRRFRAACVVYTRLRDGDLLAQIDEDVGVVLSHNSTVTSDTSTACATQNQNRNKKSVHKKETETETERGWPGAARGSCRVKLPRRVFTAACRAAVGSRDVVFAKRIAIDMAADDVKYDSYTVAALTSLLGSSGNATDQDTAFAVFVSARDAPDTQLGGAAWSCAIGGLCRAGRLDKAIELLREMGNEPFMAGGVAAGKGNETDDDEDGTGDDVDENQTNSESEETKKSNHNLFAARRTSHAKAARVAARERAAAAPAYAQLVHALCDANRPADALGVHDEMTLAGVYAPANPPHYRALFKALCLGGGPGGGAMAPRKAAAAAVADAVRAATAASKAQSKRTARKDSFDAVDAVDAVDDDGASRGDGTDDVSTSPCTADAAAVRDAASSPSRGMAAAMSLTQSKFAGHAIRCTLQIAAEGGFPDVSSEARARLRWARVDPAPTDLELTLEAYSNAGDPRGAVAHWNANRRALLAEAEARRVDDGTGTSSLGNNGNTPTSWEVGADGVVVLGCEPSRRAWTAIIKAHCDLDEPSDAAALLREAVESEARRDSRAGGAFGLGMVGAGGAPGEGARSRRRDETQTTNREQTNMKAPSPQKQKQKPSDANKLRGVERVAFNLVAACYSRARAPRRAEDLLWLMDAAGVAPDAVTYNTVIGAYAAAARPPPSGGSAGRYRRLGYQSGLAINSGVGAMDDMIELALDTDVRFACASLGSSSVGGTLGVTKTFAPDEEFTEHDGGSTHEEESCVESCFRLLLEMRSKRAGALVPTIRTWTAVLTACARSGDVDNANEAFDRMRASGVVADRNAWTALIKAHASGGDTRGAAEAYWKMRASGIVPDEATLSAALSVGPVRDGSGSIAAAAAMALYRDARLLDVKPNNEGFRRLTGMWVDQAFDVCQTTKFDSFGGNPTAYDADGTANTFDAANTFDGRANETSSGSPRSNAFAPDFMLASLLDEKGGFCNRDGSYSRSAGSTARRPLVDVHGLSTPETRAAVLSVLQALRERRRAKLVVAGDLVIVTGTASTRGNHGNGNGHAAGPESTLRDAVKGLAKDLGLHIQEVPENKGRLVVKETELLKWLDRDRALGGALGGGAGEATKSAENTLFGQNKNEEENVHDKNKSAARKYTRRGYRSVERPGFPGQVPGLEGALKTWLRENES